MSIKADIRPPAEALPALSCDCQFHTFGDAARFPSRDPNSIYKLPPAPWESALRTHRALGFGRGLLVQPTAYKTDPACLLDSLAGLPRDRYRGVALIDDSVSDAALQRLHDAGVRGVRFVFWKKLGQETDAGVFRRSVERVRALGWFLKVIVAPAEMPAMFEALCAIDGIPVVLDHMAKLEPLAGLDDPGFAMVAALLRKENYWMMLSNGHRYPECQHNSAAVAALGNRLYTLAPDRTIWGSDWPHLGRDPWSPDDAGMIELLYRYLPDRAARQAVLVDNPARLLGF